MCFSLRWETFLTQLYIQSGRFIVRFPGETVKFNSSDVRKIELFLLSADFQDYEYSVCF